jgi:uncharacterized protein
MRLNVLADRSGQRAWYSQGLHFSCTQCGNCCTGGPGYVWITTEEIVRLADHLGLTPQQIVEKYCRKIDGRFSLKERPRDGLYDCIFLQEQPVPAEPGQPASTEVRRTCAVYPVRPLQCRTWPFWEGNLKDARAWSHAAGRCPGMNQGRRFTVEQIHAIRDAAEWPKDPPSSL